MYKSIKAAVGGLGGAAGLAVGIGVAPPAGATQLPPNCVSQPWGFLGVKGLRQICDDPIRPDGSWMRHRVIGQPAYYARPSTHCSFGDYSSDCYYDEGGYVPESDSDDEWYPVTPDTVLPDEPGHLG
jgi:hypothetical protein